MTENYVRDWDELANADAKWAIVSDPLKKYNKWDNSAFFKTGEEDVSTFMQKIRKYNIITNYNEALDFGCGIGRLSRALARFYKKVYGVDVSEKMISEAGKINKESRNITFMKNTEPDLNIFEDKKFDLIYSVIVLQHLPDKELIRSFLKEFIRILKPKGILFFQLPSIRGRSLFFNKLLKVRSRIYHLMVGAGFRRQFCFKKLNLSPYMYMNFIPSEEIRSIFAKQFILLELTHDQSIETSYIFQKI